MKRLCVFYIYAWKWLAKHQTVPIEWIICKECAKRLKRGDILELKMGPPY